MGAVERWRNVERSGAVAGPGRDATIAAMADPTPQQVRDFIAAGLPCQHLEVEGDGRHFFATIVSPEFEGLLRVRRQRCLELTKREVGGTLQRLQDQRHRVRQIFVLHCCSSQFG